MTGFSKLHPFVEVTFFLFVLAFAMFVSHPWVQLLGLVLAAAMAFFCAGGKKFLRQLLLVVPLMLLLPGVFGLGADGVYWSEPISDLLGGGAAFTTLMLTVYRPLAKELKEETLCQN